MTAPRQLKELYNRGQNITTFLRQEFGLEINSQEIIELSYDLQTGAYIEILEEEEVAQQNEIYCREIAETLASLCKPKSILEAGIGEATRMAGVLKNLGNGSKSHGFDISWSRVAYAKKWLQKNGILGTVLCSGDFLNIPFLDDSIDIVYTSHSIEPNRGSEEPILRELYRVARKFLVLFEPGYELANEEQRKRMDFHGYCRGLERISNSLGHNVLEHKLFSSTPSPRTLPGSSLPLTPTAITIIAKNATDEDMEPLTDARACPKYKTQLKMVGDMLFSPEALVVYPIVWGIPCLRIENGIIASKYEEVVEMALRRDSDQDAE